MTDDRGSVTQLMDSVSQLTRVSVIEALIKVYGEELDWLEGLRVMMDSGSAYSKVIGRMGSQHALYSALRRELYDMINEEF